MLEPHIVLHNKPDSHLVLGFIVISWLCEVNFFPCFSRLWWYWLVCLF